MSVTQGREGGRDTKTKTSGPLATSCRQDRPRLLGTVDPPSARDSEQQKSAEFAARSRHLRKSKVPTLWLADQGDKVFTRLCN